MTAFQNLQSLGTRQISGSQILYNAAGSFQKAGLIIIFLLLQGAEELSITQKVLQTNLHFA